MDPESREQSSGAQESDSARDDAARDGSTPGDATTPPTAATTMDDKSDNIDMWTPAVENNGLKRRRDTSEATNGVHPSEAHHAHAPEFNARESRAAELRSHEPPSRWSQGAVNGSTFDFKATTKRTDRLALNAPDAFDFLAPKKTRSCPRFANPRASTYVKAPADTELLHIARVEPQLVDILVHIWHLRTYIRDQRYKSAGAEIWWDEVIINDTFGINQAIARWTPDHTPGSLQYPASMLYKQAVWIYFNRTIQPSRPSQLFNQLVDDGLHYLKALPCDQNALLMPLMLLGVAAFDEVQRAKVQVEITRFQASINGDLLRHIEGVCGRLWLSFDAREQPAFTSWDWEHISKSNCPDTVRVEDPFLAEILGLSTLDERVAQQLDPMDIDERNHNVNGNSQRESPVLARATANLLAMVKEPDSNSEQMEVESRPGHPEFPETHRHRPTTSASSASVGTPNHAARPSGATDPYIPGWRSYESRKLPEPIATGPPSRNSFPQSYATMYAHTQPPTPREAFSMPRPRIPRITPPESQGVGSPSEQNHDPTRRHSVYSQSVFSTTMDGEGEGDDDPNGPPRKIARSRAKAPLPPCNMCGKRFKNPSDEQKHRLQHEKPFRCDEAGCTRTEGFATINDLQRHQVSVHRASLANARKTGYVCAACPAPAEGQTRKFWPRRDNFKAHIRRKHQHWNESQLLDSSETGRPSEGETGYGSKPPRASSPRILSPMQVREIAAEAIEDGRDEHDQDDGPDEVAVDTSDRMVAMTPGPFLGSAPGAAPAPSLGSASEPPSQAAPESASQAAPEPAPESAPVIEPMNGMIAAELTAAAAAATAASV